MNGLQVMLIVFLYAGLCIVIGAWSREKGGSFVAGFFMAMIISPLLAGLILAVRKPLVKGIPEAPVVKRTPEAPTLAGPWWNPETNPAIAAIAIVAVLAVAAGALLQAQS